MKSAPSTAAVPYVPLTRGQQLRALSSAANQYHRRAFKLVLELHDLNRLMVQKVQQFNETSQRLVGVLRDYDRLANKENP